ncbi:histidine phosphatase family protein [Aetokthonos hydrillicola Thurmond2011]|uniref:Histidine phosphatase family protein n=1 Tax=Aetokthonos hydrillicola Thurmond2011 TaxID=2712845 RepID=A0AAP5I7U6_9CYAN|nr:histidine phosphatase family protein [Aetokthonos hydrillicola]MBO3460395.1 histidine phosphatase family protein [Aetokthonos hydrillicola CCALA 1050]MBW4584483.1 histidine phosphatase family protein [Aetokthonos hydrillicola CCALA 1050]MDR9896446.1 histidine phosphatase family protein [Aetokthonos hydrillicola Thurmond2011]
MKRLNRRTIIKAISAAPAFVGLSALLSKAKAGDGSRFEVWFIRHGESEINVLPPQSNLPLDEGVTYPLTLKGIQQVKDLASSIKDIDVSAIFTSTRLRTVQTADALSFEKNIQLQLAPQIVEVNFGTTTSQPQILQILSDWLLNGLYDTKAPGGESYNDQRERFIPFVTQTIEQYSSTPKVLIFVAHGAILATMLPLLFKNVSGQFSLANILPNTGIVKGKLVHGRLVCTDWNGKKPQ